ncbi:MAG: rod shape-determining protein RodA, partial [Spirochaetota bacterium]|nr:rod shape-determining protein RodA [Spirochaetota bacterium]
MGYARSRERSHSDYWLISAALFLILTGILTVYSTSLSWSGSGAIDKEFYMQLVWVLVGAALFFITLSVSYMKFVEWSVYLYGIGLLALLATFVFPPVNGTRWINLGFCTIQPAEPMKLCLVIVLARFLNMLGDSIRDIRNFIIFFIILLPPLGLVALQPDFGTSLAFLPIAFAMLFAAGAKLEHIFSLFSFGILGGGIPMIAAYYKETGETSGWLVRILSDNAILLNIILILAIIIAVMVFLWFFTRRQVLLRFGTALLVIVIGLGIAVSLNSYMQPYQRKRIVTFFDSEKDPWGTGYNINQSKIAIGSGGFFGKGFTKGPQNALSFLPENKTDFIYSTLGEEWGFVGSFFLLLAYSVFLYRAILIAINAREMLGSLIAIGIVAMFAFHIFVNIGMATGVMPVTGLPLPFVSYGGSNLLTNII